MNYATPYGTVLLAEDDALLHEVMHEILEHANYHVLSAHDGHEAINTFQRHKDDISLALLDIIMPKKSGIEVAETILNARPDLPIIFATGHDNDEFSGHRKLSRSFPIIRKPYDMDILLELIKQYLFPAD